MSNRDSRLKCEVCGKEFSARMLVPFGLVRPTVAELIERDHPAWSEGRHICLTDLNHYRNEYIAKILVDQRGELSNLEQQVVDSLREHELLAENLNEQFDQQITFGERLADKVADFGGSWTFIITFGTVLFTWIILNSVAILFRPFDPYPYILLNLVLSCLAALQAPIIMMSQNRQEAKDRLRSEHDFRVNLKAELEIRQLHAKVDLLLTHQWQRLLEIQQMQTDLLEEIASGKNHS